MKGVSLQQQNLVGNIRTLIWKPVRNTPQPNFEATQEPEPSGTRKALHLQQTLEPNSIAEVAVDEHV